MQGTDWSSLQETFLMESGQCMYTPEFSSHTKGLKVENKQNKTRTWFFFF
jgi:hypothetical protein